MEIKDFNNNTLNIGDIIFFNHKMSQQVIAKISYTKSGKTLFIKSTDIIKCSDSLKKHINNCEKINNRPNIDKELYIHTLCVYCGKVIKIN